MTRHLEIQCEEMDCPLAGDFCCPSCLAHKCGNHTDSSGWCIGCVVAFLRAQDEAEELMPPSLIGKHRLGWHDELYPLGVD